MDLLDRLEKWESGHKARSVSISIDNGYGASCWEVHLHHELIDGRKETLVAEINMMGEPPNDWPGLKAVLTEALRRVGG